ncbi:MAG: nitroreductase family protein [Bacteroidales bacterium]
MRLFATTILTVAALAFSCATLVAQNPAIENIMQRKSVRTYQDRAVEREKIDTLLRAAMAAPTAGNKQPWSFIVIEQKENLLALAEALPYAKMLTKAPLAIVVCGIPSKSFPDKGAEYWIQDCSAATENLLLAAEAIGLGAVWTGVHPIEERVKDVQGVLNIPSDVIPLCVIPIGYPTGREKPKDKWKPELIHWEKW